MTTNTLAARPLNQDHEGTIYRHLVYAASKDRAAGSAVALIPNFMGISQSTAELVPEFAAPDRDVLVIDVFGVDGRPASFPEAAQKSDALRASPHRLAAQVRGAIELFLEGRSHGPERLAIIGFCFGGAVALEVGRTGMPLNAVVALHADLTTRFPADEVRHRARILTVQGSADPLVPLAQIQGFQQEMAGAGDIEWRLLVLGGLYHAFTDPAANTPGVSRYDAEGRGLSFRMANEFIG